MKFNESLVNKILESIEYSINITPKVREDFPSFFRTLNVFNIVLEDGGCRRLVKANDYYSYDINDYFIFSEFAQLILPSRVAVLSQDATAIDARSSLYYRDDELCEAKVMTPAQFKGFQQGLLYRFRMTPESWQSVGELKKAVLSISDAVDRLAVYKGYNSALANIVEAMGLIKSDIVTEPPVKEKFPIVVSSWYKESYNYGYSAEDAVINFFNETLHKLK